MSLLSEYRPHQPPSGSTNNNPAASRYSVFCPFGAAVCDADGFRLPVDVMDLWCLQAEATMSFMAEKEQALKDLSLTLPFFLLEVRVRACVRASVHL